MKPSNKSPEMNAALQNIFGVDRMTAIKTNRCVNRPIGCGGPVEEFRDELSRKEYSISGFCQKCQDSIFG